MKYLSISENSLQKQKIEPADASPEINIQTSGFRTKPSILFRWIIMKLTEKLKENVEKTENKEEDVKEITEKAGMKLTDEDMD